ncbi:MAG TPA: GyrI-like domain-containing protein [Candidatus Bilophila faecipullorum]|uniref:GyrI-like domain-containing protein n=1 Tax=Candidatus Bilophila faecipullorum TaxID=2838482 RepID=A0A9D1UA74_9BACT|nr:GyrI-like domain-containing protein [uncultured Bilophila sp.]HIW79828.1 GyrI-like domain-containing protein [Candidatus Bilophila faecipullorum]
MKYEWKKQEKDLYGAKAMPSLVTVPAQNFILIRGKGNPNDAAFSDRVAALYAVAYAIKMGYKAAAVRNAAAEAMHDFAVYPLEGVWSQKAEGGLVKDMLEYAIMLRQPDCISESEVDAALEKVKKKPNPFYTDIRFESMQDGQCMQVLHTGAFDDEPASLEKMARFAEEQGLRLDRSRHREIYLNNPHRVEAGKLKTILRISLK